MAEEAQINAEHALPSKPASNPVLWIAVVAIAAVVLLSVISLSVAYLMSKGQSVPAAPTITITNASNNTETKPLAPAPVVAQANSNISRPDRAPEAQASRMSGQAINGPQQLPGALASPTVVPGQRNVAALSVRADTQSPPYYATLTPTGKVHFRVRPEGPAGMRGPVPFRLHAWQPGADGRVSAVSAGTEQAGNEEQFSYLPDVSFRPSGGKGKLLAVTVTSPRKSSVVNNLRAPKGFQFLVAELGMKNEGASPLALDPDMFEVRDADKLPYLANPELLGANFPMSGLAAGAEAHFMASFLVPADAALQALVFREPGDGLIESPLAVLP